MRSFALKRSLGDSTPLSDRMLATLYHRWRRRQGFGENWARVWYALGLPVRPYPAGFCVFGGVSVSSVFSRAVFQNGTARQKRARRCLALPIFNLLCSPRRAQTRRGACGRDVFVGAHGRAPLPRRLLCLLWTFCAFCGFPALPQKRAGFRRGAAPFWSAATSRRFPKRCQGTALQKRARRCLAPTLYNLLFPLTRLRERVIIMTDRSVIIPLPFTR